MAYSHSRLRKTLALVRIVTGVVFIVLGANKISSLEFGRIIFPAFLQQAINGGSVGWLRPLLEWIFDFGAARIGILLGFAELAIGISLFLGLVVRPASLLGIAYTAFLLLATWNGVETASMMQTADHQFRNLFPTLVLLLLGVGHAGETWGLGALYHHHRARQWQRDNAAAPVQPRLLDEAAEEDVNEPSSFAAFLEQEERMAESGKEPIRQASEIHQVPEP